MEEKISGISSGRLIRLAVDSRNCPRHIAAKYGDAEITFSCAAKSLCSSPTQIVTMGEVKVLIAKNSGYR